jgi:AraC-like DNA-binding protein
LVKHLGHLFPGETILLPEAEWHVDADGWIFVRVSAGEACWIHDSKPFLLAAGDVLLASPKCHGILRASRLASVAITYFRFCPELLGGFLTVAERVDVERAARRAEAKVFRAGDKLSREFDEISRLKADHNQLVVRSRLLQMAAGVLVRSEPKGVKNNGAFLPANKRVELLLRQLPEAELLNHSAEDLAAHCGCSVRHLNKLFRSLFGISLRAKQQELRLLKARQLLAETDTRIIDVASGVGFQEQAVFSAAFKKRFGVTPSKWRQTTKQNGGFLEGSHAEGNSVTGILQQTKGRNDTGPI